MKRAAAMLDSAPAEARDLATGARRKEIEELEAKLAEAKAQLELAESEKNRWTRLVEKGVASKAQGDQVRAEYNIALATVDEIEASIEVAVLPGRDARRQAAAANRSAAQAALEEAEWVLQERSVVAKVTGEIEAIYHREGEYVGATGPVVAILPDHARKVRFFVPQRELTGLEPGQAVNVKADGEDVAITAIISFVASETEFTPPVIYSTKSREKLVFLVEARLPDGSGFRPGLPVDISIP